MIQRVTWQLKIGFRSRWEFVREILTTCNGRSTAGKAENINKSKTLFFFFSFLF